MSDTADVFDRFFPFKALRFSDVIDAALGVLEEGAPIEALKMPVFATVYSCNICSANCPWCIMSREKAANKTLLPRATLFKFMDDCARLGIGYLHVSGGGEPLISPWTKPALAHLRTLPKLKRYPCDKEHVRVTLSTHGGLLDDDFVELVEDCRISLNAGTKPVHQREMDLPEKQNWDVVLANAQNFRDRQKALYGGDPAHSVGFAFVISQNNVESIPEFVKLAAEMGMDFAQIRPAFYPKSDPLNEVSRRLAPEAMALCEAARKRWGDRLLVKGMTRAFEGYWGAPAYQRCRATPLECVLKATGQLAICQDVLDGVFAWGNYHEMTFEEMWYSPEHLRALTSIDLPSCPRCIRSRTNQAIEALFVDDAAARTSLI